MSFVINGVKIASKDDYLSKGTRSRINSTMRSDLNNEFALLMKHLREPMSIGYDVLVTMLKDNPTMLDEFIKRCKEY